MLETTCVKHTKTGTGSELGSGWFGICPLTVPLLIVPDGFPVLLVGTLDIISDDVLAAAQAFFLVFFPQLYLASNAIVLIPKSDSLFSVQADFFFC